MDMFSAIQYVATPIALIAFIVAVAATVYRTRSRQDLDLIKSAPDADRAKLIERLIEKEGLDKYDPDDLTREQRYNLLMTTLQQRMTRLRIVSSLAIGVLIIVAVLIGSIIFFDPNGASAANNPALTPTVGRPPVIVEEISSFDEVSLFPMEYLIANDTSWTVEAAEELIRLTELSQVILEDDQAAYEARFVVKNATSENISLTLSPSFFSLGDNQGLVAEQLYFCCSVTGAVLAPGQEREVHVFFQDLWLGGKYEPPASPPSVTLTIRGLAPVTRATWDMPLLLTAE